MSEVKHTPGPWLTEDNVMAKGILHFAVTARHADPDYFICSITPMSLKRAQDIANARLIAAAPELLEACKAILTLEELEMGDDSLLPPEHPKTMVYAAIAKAEGQQ